MPGSCHRPGYTAPVKVGGCAPEAAELTSLHHSLLAPGELPGLWQADSIGLADLRNYFSGTHVTEVSLENYQERVPIPKVDEAIIKDAVREAVQKGIVWLTDGPASILEEEVPAGYPTEKSVLQAPPDPIPPLELIPESLEDPWSEKKSTALTLASALSSKAGKTLPWVTVRRAIDDALKLRLIERSEDSGPWPCGYPQAGAAEGRNPFRHL